MLHSAESKVRTGKTSASDRGRIGPAVGLAAPRRPAYGNQTLLGRVKPLSAPSGGAAEREANAIAAEIVPGYVGDRFMRGQGEPAGSDRVATLPARTRLEMEEALGADFGQVRVHTGPHAEASAHALRAQAFTQGRDIFFNAGRYDPRGTAGRRLVAHELVHVLQQADSGQSAIQRQSELETLPEAERKKVRVLTSLIGPEARAILEKDYLLLTSRTLPAGLTVQFAASVAAARRPGLTNVVGALVGPSQAGGSILPRNSETELAMPVAQAIFRFTRVDHAATPAAGGTPAVPTGGPAPAAPTGGPAPLAPKQDTTPPVTPPVTPPATVPQVPVTPATAAPAPVPEIVLVEEIGALPAPVKPMAEAFPGPFSEAQGPLPERDAEKMRDCLADGADIDACRRIVLGIGAPPSTPITLAAGAFEVRTVKMKRAANWKEDDWRAVTSALEALPDIALKQAEGVTFVREAVKVCKPEELAAKTCSPNRSGETNAVNKTITIFDSAFAASDTRFGTATWLQQTVAHEIGHEADYRPLGAAFSQFQKSKDESKVLAARTRSGSAFVKHAQKGRNLYQVTEVGGGATKGTFREAAISDGLQVTNNDKQITGGGVTAYGETNWGELFAESFALYMVDPDVLKAIRPNCFAYLEKTYPKTPAKSP